MVKTRPFSFKWSDQTITISDIKNKPVITTLALVVEKEEMWMTSF
ncbi:hypothetical protein [Dehalococcoides mccartyi]|nr:hypothetical protein [Dehalococcoides mccartyi]